MKKVISIALALCLCLVCFVGCGEKVPEGYEDWNSGSLEDVSYWTPPEWEFSDESPTNRVYTVDDNTVVCVMCDDELDGITESAKVIEEMKNENRSYRTFLDNITIDGETAYHFIIDGQKTDPEDFEMFDDYLFDSPSKIFRIRTIYDKNAGNPIPEDLFQKFLDSVKIEK